MKLIAISNAIIYTGEETLLNKTILIEGDKIKAIVGAEEIPTDYEIFLLAVGNRNERSGEANQCLVFRNEHGR